MKHARKPKVHQSVRRFALAFAGLAGVAVVTTIAIPGTGSATDIYGQCDAPVMQAWEGCGHRTSDAEDDNDFLHWDEEMAGGWWFGAHLPVPELPWVAPEDFYEGSPPTDMPPPPPPLGQPEHNTSIWRVLP